MTVSYTNICVWRLHPSHMNAMHCLRSILRAFGYVPPAPFTFPVAVLLFAFAAPERVEDLVVKLGVEAFAVSVFPWAAGFDIQGFDADPFQPVAQGSGDELGAVV